MALGAASRRPALDLEAIVVEQAARIALLEARVGQLEQAGRSRDAADAALRQQLPSSTRGLPFRSADLLQRAPLDEALAEALVAADVVNVADVGVWLRDHAGVENGVAIVRLRKRRWQVRHVMCAG
jgi:hypothetical protein